MTYYRLAWIVASFTLLACSIFHITGSTWKACAVCAFAWIIMPYARDK